jgi:hypothetical protein
VNDVLPLQFAETPPEQQERWRRCQIVSCVAPVVPYSKPPQQARFTIRDRGERRLNTTGYAKRFVAFRVSLLVPTPYRPQGPATFASASLISCGCGSTGAVPPETWVQSSGVAPSRGGPSVPPRVGCSTWNVAVSVRVHIALLQAKAASRPSEGREFGQLAVQGSNYQLQGLSADFANQRAQMIRIKLGRWIVQQ